MDSQNKKCSLENHQDKDAIAYCSKCENFMCKKCELFHSEFFKAKHNQFIYEQKNFANIKESILGNDNLINEEDIKYLKDFSNKLKDLNEKLIEELEKINLQKEELIIKTQKYFTLLRNELNKSEDELLLEIEIQYEKIPLNQKIKENDLLIKDIKAALNKEKNINFDSLIKQCKEKKENILMEKDEIIKDNKINILIPTEKDIDNICQKIISIGKMNKLIIDSSIIKDNLKGQNLINEWIKEKNG